jgi:hypothetical protein
VLFVGGIFSQHIKLKGSGIWVLNACQVGPQVCKHSLLGPEVDRQPLETIGLVLNI